MWIWFIVFKTGNSYPRAFFNFPTTQEKQRSSKSSCRQYSCWLMLDHSFLWPVSNLQQHFRSSYCVFGGDEVSQLVQDQLAFLTRNPQYPEAKKLKAGGLPLRLGVLAKPGAKDRGIEQIRPELSSKKRPKVGDVFSTIGRDGWRTKLVDEDLWVKNYSLSQLPSTPESVLQHCPETDDHQEESSNPQHSHCSPEKKLGWFCKRGQGAGGPLCSASWTNFLIGMEDDWQVRKREGCGGVG